MDVLSIIGVTAFVIMVCRYIVIDGQRARRQKKFMDNMRKNNFDKSGK